MDIFDDLVAEQDRLEHILASLDAKSWEHESGAAGWTVADVVLHLAQGEEAVVATVTAGGNAAGGARWRSPGEALDDAIERQLRTEQAASPASVWARWNRARHAAVAGLRAADASRPLSWAAAPLKPVTLATTRLAEHWAHGLDITGPLGIVFPDTARLHHVAWLGHATLPYAFAIAGRSPGEVCCDLVAPDGTAWRFGDPHASSRIRGPAGEFCRVGARRLRPEQTTLVAEGPHGASALDVLRNYAG